MKKVKRFFGLWAFRSIMLFALALISVIPGACFLSEAIALLMKRESNAEAVLVCFTLLAVYVLMLLLYRRYLAKKSAEAHAMTPLAVDTGYSEVRQLKETLKQSVRVHKVSDCCWYAQLRKRYRVRIFLFDCKASDAYIYAEAAEQAVRKVNIETNFHPARNVEETIETARINAYVFDKIPWETVRGICEQAEEYIGKVGESILNFYFDLSERKLYIPVCCPCQSDYWYALKYNFCVRQFCRIMQIE